LYNIIKEEKLGFPTLIGRIYTSVLIGASYSSTNTNLANYNSGQDLFDSNFREVALEWLAERNVTSSILNTKMEEYGDTSKLDDFLNANVLSLVRGAVTAENSSFCEPDYEGYNAELHGKLCEALKQNDLTETVENVQYPVVICHSVNDELVPFSHVPDVTKNPFLILKELETTHNDSIFSCLIDQIFLLSTDLSRFASPPKHLEGGCSGGRKEDPDQEFLLKWTGEWVANTKKCRYISKRSVKAQKRICSNRRHQIRSMKKNLAPASVACFESCAPYCVREFETNRFILKTKMKNGVVTEVSKACKWLKKRPAGRIATICATAVNYESSIFGQAADVCTDICNKPCEA